MPSTSPLPIFEQADHWFRRARASLLEALPCRNGCSRCCIGPFPITMLDVDELQRGMAALPSERRAGIVERAVRQTTAIQAAYPQLGDDRKLDDWSDQVIDELMTRFADLPCPLSKMTAPAASTRFDRSPAEPWAFPLRRPV